MCTCCPEHTIYGSAGKVVMRFSFSQRYGTSLCESFKDHTKGSILLSGITNWVSLDANIATSVYLFPDNTRGKNNKSLVWTHCATVFRQHQCLDPLCYGLQTTSMSGPIVLQSIDNINVWTHGHGLQTPMSGPTVTLI